MYGYATFKSKSGNPIFIVSSNRGIWMFDTHKSASDYIKREKNILGEYDPNFKFSEEFLKQNEMGGIE